MGDWGGARSGLAKHGIIVDVQATQFYQGVVDGSAGSDDGQYGVKGDLFLTLIGEKLGLWKGLNASIHVESRLSGGRTGQEIPGESGPDADI